MYRIDIYCMYLLDIYGEDMKSIKLILCIKIIGCKMIINIIVFFKFREFPITMYSLLLAKMDWLLIGLKSSLRVSSLL